MRLAEHSLHSYRLRYERPVRWSDIVEACARRPPVMRCFTTLSSFWHKWSDYAAICASMRAPYDARTGPTSVRTTRTPMSRASTQPTAASSRGAGTAVKERPP